MRSDRLTVRQCGVAAGRQAVRPGVAAADVADRLQVPSMSAGRGTAPGRPGYPGADLEGSGRVAVPARRCSARAAGRRTRGRAGGARLDGGPALSLARVAVLIEELFRVR